MLALAHDGAAALRDTYEPVYRRRSEYPNATWQVDHTELDSWCSTPASQHRPRRHPCHRL